MRTYAAHQWIHLIVELVLISIRCDLCWCIGNENGQVPMAMFQPCVEINNIVISQVPLLLLLALSLLLQITLLLSGQRRQLQPRGRRPRQRLPTQQRQQHRKQPRRQRSLRQPRRRRPPRLVILRNILILRRNLCNISLVLFVLLVRPLCLIWSILYCSLLSIVGFLAHYAFFTFCFQEHRNVTQANYDICYFVGWWYHRCYTSLYVFGQRDFSISPYQYFFHFWRLVK